MYFVLLSCVAFSVAWCVSCESVLALFFFSGATSLGRGRGESRVPSLMAAAVESEASDSYFFSFIFDVSSMGQWA